MGTINLKYQEQTGMKNLNYFTDLLTISNSSSRSMKQLMLNHRCEYMSTKFKIKLYPRLKLSTILKF